MNDVLQSRHFMDLLISMDPKCPLCGESFSPQLETIVTRCGHLFCAECWAQWVEISTGYYNDVRSTRCPMCRRSLTDDDYLKSEINHKIDINVNTVPPQDEMCSICLEDAKDNDRWGHLKCGHAFHEGCVSTWLNKNPTCPMCRAKQT